MQKNRNDQYKIVKEIQSVMWIKEIRYRRQLWSAISIIGVLMACVCIYLFCCYAETGGFLGMVCMVVAACASFAFASLADLVSGSYENMEKEYEHQNESGGNETNR